MDPRSVSRPAGTSNIVPGMPGDHPASIPEARAAPGLPSGRWSESPFLFRKLTAGLPSEHQLQNPAHVPRSHWAGDLNHQRVSAGARAFEG